VERVGLVSGVTWFFWLLLESKFSALSQSQLVCILDASDMCSSNFQLKRLIKAGLFFSPTYPDSCGMGPLALLGIDLLLMFNMVGARSCLCAAN